MTSTVHAESSSIKEKMALSGREDLMSFSSDDEEPEESLCEAFQAKCTLTSTTATHKPRLAACANPLALATEFSQLEQTASVREYAVQVDDYIARLNWPDAMAVSGFRRGLKPYIENALEATEGVYRVSYADIKTMACKLEQELLEPVNEVGSSSDDCSVPKEEPSKEKKNPVIAPNPIIISKAPLSPEKRLDQAAAILQELIPSRLRTTPGTDKPLLWYCAIKYIDIFANKSTLTPFDVCNGPFTKTLAEHKQTTRLILWRMTPPQYQPKKLDITKHPELFVVEAALTYIGKCISGEANHTLSKNARKAYNRMQLGLQAVKHEKEVAKKLKAMWKDDKEPQPLLPKTVTGVGLRTRSAQAQQRPDPQAIAREAVRTELIKLPFKGIDWDDSASVMVNAEQRIKDLNAVLEKLKDAVKSKK